MPKIYVTDHGSHIRLANPAQATRSYEISNIGTAHHLFGHTTVTHFVIHLPNGSSNYLFYHPGSKQVAWKAIQSLVDLLIRLGSISLVRKANFPNGVLLLKNGSYIANDAQSIRDYFTDGNKFHTEGYYIDNDLILAGRVTQ